jgi:hypothetical protein
MPHLLKCHFIRNKRKVKDSGKFDWILAYIGSHKHSLRLYEIYTVFLAHLSWKFKWAFLISSEIVALRKNVVDSPVCQHFPVELRFRS